MFRCYGVLQREATCKDSRRVKSNSSWSENDESFEAVDASLFRKASFCKRPVLHNGMSYICFQIAEFGWYRFFSSPESSSFHEEIHINVYTPLPLEMSNCIVIVLASELVLWRAGWITKEGEESFCSRCSTSPQESCLCLQTSFLWINNYTYPSHFNKFLPILYRNISMGE